MFAGSVKIDPVCVDRSFAAGSCGIHHGIDISHAWKIVNALTAGADEVMMPLYICIKPVGSFARGDLHDLTHFSEESKIPVDCAETDIRILLTEAGIDRVGSGMIGTTGKKLLDCLSLSAIFSLHTLHLLDNNNCYYNQYNRRSITCQVKSAKK